jgi:hypothetical protein
MSKRGGMRQGAGRPPKDDHYDDAYQVWAFIQRRVAEGEFLKNAKKDAAKEFGMCATTITRQLEYVGKVFEILAHLQDQPERFNPLVESLVAHGWFGDEP